MTIHLERSDTTHATSAKSGRHTVRSAVGAPGVPAIPVVIRAHVSAPSAVAPGVEVKPAGAAIDPDTAADIAALRERGLRARRFGEDARSARLHYARGASERESGPVGASARGPVPAPRSFVASETRAAAGMPIRSESHAGSPALSLNQAMVAAAAGIVVGFVFFVLVLTLV
ncbi:hypothetical protein [Dietzia sp.]|uniref:hypothetical protein n=1 Tax=Dietzia sp. TaxID=1871616 RepID=UPI002FDB0260